MQLQLVIVSVRSNNNWRKKSMIHSFTITFGAKYLTGMVTSVHPYETFSLIKNNILHQSKYYRNHFENSNF
jgi:hypothetical protein